MLLKSPKCFFFRDASVCHTIQMMLEQVPLLFWRKVTIVRKSAIVRVRHQIHDVFFEVGAGTRDNVHFVLTDHLCKADAQFGGAHRSCEGHHHFFPFSDMFFIRLGGIYKSRGIKMEVVFFDESGDRSVLAHSV